MPTGRPPPAPPPSAAAARPGHAFRAPARGWHSGFCRGQGFSGFPSPRFLQWSEEKPLICSFLGFLLVQTGVRISFPVEPEGRHPLLIFKDMLSGEWHFGWGRMSTEGRLECGGHGGEPLQGCRAGGPGQPERLSLSPGRRWKVRECPWMTTSTPSQRPEWDSRKKGGVAWISPPELKVAQHPGGTRWDTSPARPTVPLHTEHPGAH